MHLDWTILSCVVLSRLFWGKVFKNAFSRPHLQLHLTRPPKDGATAIVQGQIEMAESLQLLWASHRGLTSGCLRAGFGDCDCSVRAEQTGQCGKARAIHQGSLTANVHYPAIFEKSLLRPLLFRWRCVRRGGCRTPLKADIHTARCRANRLYTLHLVCWVIKMWKTEWPKITVRVTGEGEEECCNLFHKENRGLWLVQDYFPISLPPPLPLTPEPGWHARPWPPPQHGAEGVQSLCACVCCVCFIQLGGPRPRICCGSVQWTGARQDVTFWRKLGRPYRPSGYQSTPFVPPPPRLTTSNTQED